MATFERAGQARGAFAPSTMAAASLEDAFLAWVLWLPVGADIAECARMEIARIDGSELPDACSRKLRAMFVEAAGVMALPC